MERSITAPVLRCALHTPCPTGDPALLSQPNHKRPDSGSGLDAPPPPKRRSAAGAGAGPGRGRSQARLHALRPIRAGPGRGPAEPGGETAPAIFPFSATSNRDVSRLPGLRLDACVSPAEGREAYWLSSQGAGPRRSLPPLLRGSRGGTRRRRHRLCFRRRRRRCSRCAFGGGGVGGGEEGGGGGWRIERCSRSGAAAHLGEGIFFFSLRSG